MFTFTLTGVDDLAKRLHQLSTAASKRLLEAALLEAAEPMAREAAARAPRRTGELAANIAVGVVAGPELEGLRAQAAVEVGPELQPDDVFYGYFQEFGTARHAAQPFMRPAFDSAAPRALVIVVEELWSTILAKGVR